MRHQNIAVYFDGRWENGVGLLSRPLRHSKCASASIREHQAPNPRRAAPARLVHQSFAPLRDARAAARPVACSNRWPWGRPRARRYFGPSPLRLSHNRASGIARRTAGPWIFQSRRGGCRTPEFRFVTPTVRLASVPPFRGTSIPPPHPHGNFSGAASFPARGASRYPRPSREGTEEV